MTASRVVVAAPAPADGVRFDANAACDALSQVLQPLVRRGTLTLERLSPPTEAALRRLLPQAPCSVLHFIGCGSSRAAAQYETLAFEDSAGRARGMNAQYLAGLLKQRGVELMILQSCQEADDALARVGEALVRHGMPAVIHVARTDLQPLGACLGELYDALFEGSSGEQAVQRARDALVRHGCSAAGIVLHAGQAQWRLREAAGVRQPIESKAAPESRQDSAAAPAPAAAAIDEAALAAQRCADRIVRKEAAGEFDVFLCHNWADKPTVKKIAEQLIGLGVRPWLDEWELPPGRPWQPLLEQQIAHIGAAAVFVGAAGIGPWQEQELNGFLRQFAKRSSPVIPVLLPSAPEKPQLPLFLEAMTWVDFRLSSPDPLQRLVWGITGVRPAY